MMNISIASAVLSNVNIDWIGCYEKNKETTDCVSLFPDHAFY